MIALKRHPENPILTPTDTIWEHEGTFNGCVAIENGVFHMVYRGLSSKIRNQGIDMNVSSIGYAKSSDGIHFGEHRQLITPTEDWESYGVEDPRITYFNNNYYIFYTALSVYPFAAYGIKLGLAKTPDFKTFEKHPVTTFNSKAMALFPETVDGKMAAILTINTDIPPAKIAIALFDREEDIWSPFFWEEWYDNANSHTLHLLRDLRDQVELGAPPIKTKDGWLVIYSYIKNYLSDEKIFGIEAVLLDLLDPRKIIGRTEYPLLTPEKKYELEGNIQNVIFPSGALVHNNQLYVYYGAADTTGALASCNLEALLATLRPKPSVNTDSTIGPNQKKLIRFDGNPIMTPLLELDWQAKAVFNPAAIYEDGKVHLVYRAQSDDGTSVMGYATSRDGLHIDENLDYPIYTPREDFEIKPHATGNSGCEDPRVTKIGERLYMTYAAYDGINPPRVALTSIALSDFLQRRWNWDLPRLISPAGVDDKDACVVQGKNNTYIFFHRLGDNIWVEVSKHLDFNEENPLAGHVIAGPHEGKWDDLKLGIAGPPIETKDGWLLLYHGVSKPDTIYRVGAMLLDLHDPTKVLARAADPIFEPEMPYELEGLVPNVVFPCGSVVIDDVLYVYYGGADKVIGVATIPLSNLLNILLQK